MPILPGRRSSSVCGPRAAAILFRRFPSRSLCHFPRSGTPTKPDSSAFPSSFRTLYGGLFLSSRGFSGRLFLRPALFMPEF